MNIKDVTVIIPSYNRPEYALKCLKYWSNFKINVHFVDGSEKALNLEDVKKIISKSRQKLNNDMQIKREEIQKKIDGEISNAEKEIKKLKNDSSGKVSLISQDIVSNLVKDIFGEDLNKSSIEATVSQTIKEYERDKK